LKLRNYIRKNLQRKRKKRKLKLKSELSSKKSKLKRTDLLSWNIRNS
jgi:hypothetical protein